MKKAARTARDGGAVRPAAASTREEPRQTSAGLADEEIAATSVEHVSNLIRQAIVQGRWGPGERIKISECADFLGVSAMPVREALRKLEGEGIVSITPNRGATVRAVDRKFIQDVYEVRDTLELLVLQRCADSITLPKLQHLETLLAQHEKAADSGDVAAALGTARAFTNAVFEYGGNQEAERLFQRGWDIIHALRLRFGYGQERLQNMRVELRQLVEALRRHDVQQASAMVRMHNRAGMEDLLARIEKDGGSINGQ